MKQKMKVAYFIDDGQSKLDSADFAFRHLRKREEEDEKVSTGTWLFLFFLLGMLTALTLPFSLTELILAFMAG